MSFFNSNPLHMRWPQPSGTLSATQSNNNCYYNKFNSSTMPLMSSYHHMQNCTNEDSSCGIDNRYHMQNFSQPQDYTNFPNLPPPTQHHPNSTLSIANQLSLCVPYGGSYSMSTANSNRMMRNLAEKMRRDKLNAYINELAILVPMVSNSSKRMDKTSVLRLSATFLRLNALISNTKDQHPKLPQFLNTVNWSQFLLDDMDGIMLVVTSVGKIVFITHNIEKILGHTQLELFGQSLFKITAPEDHAELKKCLSPDENDENTSSEVTSETEDFKVTSSESIINSSCSTRPCANRGSNKTSSTSSQYTNGDALSVERQRRSFYLRLRHRCLARSEQPQYELVHVVGHLTIPKKFASQSQKKSRKHKVEVTATNSNEIFLVGIMKPFKERRVTELSLVEPSKDEYITRHTLDGRILYSDHRISVVAGYLSEEVAGSQAFSFMHKEDVHWVLIALRQMYWRGESYGLSCYRLKTKTGDFIYLKSHGYLEFNANTETYASFICVNSLISEEEGEREIIQMKKRYTPLIESKGETAEIVSFTVKKSINISIEDEYCTIEDPTKLKNAIDAMMLNLPKLNAGSVRDDPQKSGETPYVKAKLMSKVLPPLDIQMKDVKIVTSELSPQPLNSVSSLASPQSSSTSSTSGMAMSPPIPSRTPQNRPSVLRIAPSLASRITIYNDDENVMISSTSNISDSEKESNDSRKYDYYNESTKQVDVKQEFIKQEIPEDENFERISTPTKEQIGVVRCTNNTASSLPNSERIGVVIQRNATKRHYDFDEKSYSAVPTKKIVSSVVPRTQEQLQFPQRQLNGISSLSPPQQSFNHHLSFPVVTDVRKGEINDSLSSSIDVFTHLPIIDQCDQTTQLVDIDSYENRPEPEDMLQLLEGANEDLKHSHIKLESRIHMQGAQINAIKGDLDRVSFTTEQFCFQTDLSQLKEQHIKQKELLMTLKQDHHSLQRCNTDSVNV